MTNARSPLLPDSHPQKDLFVCDIVDAVPKGDMASMEHAVFYELARKHCGAQPKWKCGIELLRDKCGSGSTRKEFRRMLSKIIEDDAVHKHMPDYVMSVEGDDVVFRPREGEAVVALPFQALRFNKPGTHDEARRLASGCDVYVLEGELRSWVHDKPIDVKDPDKRFLAFCKKRDAYRA